MMEALDNFLSNFSLYRLTLLALIGLMLSALVLSISGSIPFSFWDIILSTSIILATGLLMNYIWSGLYGARTNIESVIITLLIVALIFPVKFPSDIAFGILAAAIAISSKYLLTVEKRHIFNPAAISAIAVTMLFPDRGATWWIGTPVMLPFVIFFGLLLLRKLRGGSLAIAFFATYLFVTGIGTFLHGGALSAVFSSWQMGLTHSALLFFAFIMLTEPLTSPANKIKKIVFAILVAILYSTIQLRLGWIALTPETALVLGNIFAFFVRPRRAIQQPINSNIQPTGIIFR